MRIRFISSCISLLILLFALFPIPAIVISVVLIAGYFIFTHFTERNIIESGEAQRRREALNVAKIYLAPYKNIWRNLKLSNRYCSLRLAHDGVSITGKENGNGKPSYRTFRVISSTVHPLTDLWDMFCVSFNHNTTYDGLVENCRKFKVIISEDIIQTSLAAKPLQNAIQKEKLKPVEKIDVNNASEVELTELPGISIVMSKKIIRKREEIGGFKNINEFFVFLKLRPHIESQLRDLVCTNKMKGSLKIQKYNERSVDL